MTQPLKYAVAEADLDRIADLLRDRTGLRFKGARRRYLRSRAQEVAERLECASVGELIERLIYEADGGDTFHALLDHTVTDETSFFRYPEQFEALSKFIIPALANNRGFGQGDRTLRILSAGCSRGQEPYSIAMACKEEAEALGDLKVAIYAVDLSRRTLDQARQGRYRKNDLRSLPDELSSKYFSPVADTKDTLEISPTLKDMIRFRQHNLKEELTGPIFDVIFCRNVTIYFDEEDTRRVALNLYNKLLPGGYLFLGHAESYYGILPNLTTLQFGEALVNKKPSV